MCEKQIEATEINSTWLQQNESVKSDDMIFQRERKRRQMMKVHDKCSRYFSGQWEIIVNFLKSMT